MKEDQNNGLDPVKVTWWLFAAAVVYALIEAIRFMSELNGHG